MSAVPEKTEQPQEVALQELQSEAADATLAATQGTSPHTNIENVPVKVSAVLGKTKIDVAQLRKLNDGAIIELDRKVGEPIDLYVNDRLIARGELVLVDGSLGVTMTEIVKENDI